MGDVFFSLKTSIGTCQVARSLQRFDVTLESYLAQRGDDTAEGIPKVVGISVRGWICDWKDTGVKLLLGQRAECDSSPNLYEPFGGKCDPNEKILEALVREIYEETNLEVSFVHEQLGEGDTFLTPGSNRWIEQIHFLVETKPKISGSREYDGIQLDPNEHRTFVWARGSPFPQEEFPLTKGSGLYLELAIKRYGQMHLNKP